MSLQSKQALLASLRHALASAISDAKAYEVPDLCSSLGLLGGTGEEAFSSKYRYVSKRLAGVLAHDLVEMAQRFLDGHASFAVSEALAKYREIEGQEVTDLTRRRLMTLFENGPLSTELDDVELLSRVWSLKDRRRSDNMADERSLEEALVQHTIRNADWDNADILKAAGLPTMSRAELFRLLAVLVDPIAQTPERQAELVEGMNSHLKHDGLRLVESGKTSGSPRYIVRADRDASPSDDAISSALAAFSPEDVHPRWIAALERRSTDPAGAITLARTLLEDVCKWILTEAGETSWKDSDDLPLLYRKLAKVLKLAPDDHAEEIFKSILGNCQSVVTSLGALRNKLGDAHSLGPKKARPLPRHAELAVNLSGTMATFLVSTWRARQDGKD